MRFVIEFLIVFHHKLLIKYIHKDLYNIWKKRSMEYSDDIYYNLILTKILKVVERYYIDRGNVILPPTKASFKRVLTRPGKGTRIALINFVIKHLNIKSQFIDDKRYRLYKIRLCEIIEAVHNLSLVVDDLLDNDELRRNEPCVHVNYGVLGVIMHVRNWLDLIFYLISNLPIDSAQKNNYKTILENTCEDVIHFVEKEIWWEKNMAEINWDQITEDVIKEIYYQKTVRIFLLGFQFIEETIDISETERAKFMIIITKLGFYLQRINDIENFNFKSKTYLSDIKNRRITLINFSPLIQRSQILKALRANAYSQNARIDDIRLYCEHLKKSGVFEAEISAINRERDEIKTQINNLFKTKADKIFLDLIFKIYGRKLHQTKIG